MMVVQNTEHVAQAKARIPGWLRDSTNFNDLIEIFADRYQQLEDELDDLLNNVTDITSGAVGVQLDVIGVILNLTRIVSELDPEYRIRLLGQAASLAKSGEPETVIEAYSLATAANRVLYIEYVPATLEVTAYVDGDTFTLAQDAALIVTMNAMVIAGVGTILQIQEENGFLFGDAPDADASGDITLDLDHGLGDEDDVDANGDIVSAPGNGGNLARIIQ